LKKSEVKIFVRIIYFNFPISKIPSSKNIFGKKGHLNFLEENFDFSLQIFFLKNCMKEVF